MLPKTQNISYKNNRHKSVIPGNNLFSLMVFKNKKLIENPNILFKNQFFVKYHENAKINPIIIHTISNAVYGPKYGILKVIKFD